jgi:hypothetical protein
MIIEEVEEVEKDIGRMIREGRISHLETAE